MKMLRRFLPLLLLVLVACAGAAARTNLQLPAMQQSWTSVRPEVAAQLAAAPDAAAAVELEEADAALQTGSPAAMAAVDWPLLLQLADERIARRQLADEIGPAVAVLLRERLHQLQQSTAIYTRTP